MTDAELLAQAKADYKECVDLMAHNRRKWAEVQKFRLGGENHWPKEILEKRKASGRPWVTVDKTEQHVRQVVNDGRQNRPSPKVSPVDDRGDVEVANAFKGLIRSICAKSNADEAFDTALDHSAGNGFGYIRVVTDYEHERSFNQEILIRRVRNPLAVLLGPHLMADGSDARKGFVEDLVPKDQFKRKWPKAKQTNWQSADFADGWFDGECVRVCEYFYIEDEDTALLLLDDGTTVTRDEYDRDQRPVGLGLGMKPDVVEERVMPTPKVKWCRMTGAEILEKNDWLGKYIPIVPVYGVEKDDNGKVYYIGMIEPAMDAQRLYDYARAGFAEHVSLSTKQPFIAAAGQLEGFEDDWEEANTENIGVLYYNPIDIDGTPVPPPMRSPGSGIPSGLAQDMQLSEHDIQGAMGQYSASLGEKSNEKSGRAIMARQREGDTGTFHFHDNLNRAIRHVCRIIVDLAPKVIDSKRAIRLLGDDGQVTIAEVDPDQEVGHRKEERESGAVSIYNLGAGLFDVELETGASYTTKRQESAEAMIELTRANPQMWSTHGDLIVKAQDWPDAQEFAERSKLVLPPEIREAIADDDGNESPEVREVVSRANQMLQEKDQQIQAAEQGIAERDQAIQQMQAEIERLKAGTDIKAIEAQAKVQTAETGQYEAETQRMTAVAPAIDPMLIAQIGEQVGQKILAALMGATPPQIPPEPPPMAPPAEEQPPSGGFFSP